MRSRLVRWFASASVALCLATHAELPANADGADNANREETAVLVTVGRASVTVAEFESRYREAEKGELAPAEGMDSRRAFLETVIIPELLLAQHGEDSGLSAEPDVQAKLTAIDRAAIISELRKSSGASNITNEDVRTYFDANPERFKGASRVGISRILVESEAEAQAIIDALSPTPDPKKWNDLAREKSKDRTTYLQGGNLGFVADDGSTQDHDRSVDRAIVAATKAVADGALVAKPVREGSMYAVVWRRQSTKALARSVEAEAPGIRASIADDRIRSAIQNLLTTLRAEWVREEVPELVLMVSIGTDGAVGQPKRPGALPRAKVRATPEPNEAAGSLR